MFYPENFLRVLGIGAGEDTQLLELWKDVERCYAEKPLFDFPTVTPSFEWLKITGWYKQGGYEEVRRKAYGDYGKQFGMQCDDARFGTTTHLDMQLAVKARWPKPC